MCVWLCVCVCVNAFIHMCVCVCVCVCTHTHMHTHAHTHKHVYTGVWPTDLSPAAEAELSRKVVLLRRAQGILFYLYTRSLLPLY